jgi:uncharacterized 2Fe-2S/4Fe-4S cluster protein (DUF4445 family)
MPETPPGWTRTVSLPSPSLADNRADAERVKAALAQSFHAESVEIGISLLRRLPDRLRRWGYALRCLCFSDCGRITLLGVKPAEDPSPFVGAAVDLGTTRVVISLVDLDGAEEMATVSFDNPQEAVGPDILTRIHSAETKDGLDRLSQLIREGLQTNLEKGCRTAGIEPEAVRLLAVSGNTAMTHLFMGLPPAGIIREPYIPAVNRPGLISAHSLDLQLHPDAGVFVFPNVGSYFGGDLISGILFSGMHEQEAVTMLVDVGTNAEVVLGNRDWLVACAGAAGPALEGGVSEIGMTAGPGVIDQVAIDPESGRFEVHTIGDEPPRGICGSGMIDLAAQLFLSGLVDVRGRLVPDAAPERIYVTGEGRRLVIVPAEESASGEALTLAQADLDSLIRSKAAMYTILETITRYVGVGFADIRRFHVAGTFGSFIRPESAITIGMIPDLSRDTYQSLGNSSLGGAVKLLKSSLAVAEIDRIYKNITYLELNVNQEFMNRFSAAKFLPHTEAALFPSVKRSR